MRFIKRLFRRRRSKMDEEIRSLIDDFWHINHPRRDEIAKAARASLIAMGADAHETLLNFLRSVSQEEKERPLEEWQRAWAITTKRGVLDVLAHSGNAQCLTALREIIQSDPSIAEEGSATLRAIAEREGGLATAPRKHCPSCGRQYEQWRSSCPHCGEDLATIAFKDAEGFLAWSGSLREREEAARLDKKGAELFIQGNLEEAEKLFMKALQLNPTLVTAHGNLGHVLQKKGMYAQAVTWLEKALSLDSHLEGVADALDFCRKAAQERVTPPSQETIARLKKGGIEFTQKYTETRIGASGLGPVEFAYEKYESSSVESAIEFLNQRGPVTQNYSYVEVMTPKGWVGRDIDGIYKEWEQ